MQTTWILTADSSRARIFEMHDRQDHLHEIEDFANAAGHANIGDLRTDARGRFYGKGEREQAHTSEPEIDPVMHETELFSKQVSEFLDKACSEHRYDKLYVIAFPKFLGLMRQNMSKQVQRLVEEEVPKDMSKFDIREIEDYVRNQLH